MPSLNHETLLLSSDSRIAYFYELNVQELTLFIKLFNIHIQVHLQSLLMKKDFTPEGKQVLRLCTSLYQKNMK